MMVMQSICGLLYACVGMALYSVVFQTHRQRSAVYLGLALLFSFVEVVHLRHMGVLPNAGLLIAQIDAITTTMAVVDGLFCLLFWFNFYTSVRSDTATVNGKKRP
jgi:uncharacterized membrane protein